MQSFRETFRQTVLMRPEYLEDELEWERRLKGKEATMYNFIVLIPEDQKQITPELTLQQSMEQVSMPYLGKCKKLNMTADEFRRFVETTQTNPLEAPARYYVERYHARN